MKTKLNNKGIAHHLLLIVVGVVAVIGAAGFFVWQRQNNNDLSADAAGLPLIPANNQASYKSIRMFGCKQPASPNAPSMYSVRFRGDKFLGGGSTSAATGYSIMQNGYVRYTVSLARKNSASAGPMPAYARDKITLRYTTGQSNRLNPQEFYAEVPVSSIRDCL